MTKERKSIGREENRGKTPHFCAAAARPVAVSSPRPAPSGPTDGVAKQLAFDRRDDIVAKREGRLSEGNGRDEFQGGEVANMTRSTGLISGFVLAVAVWCSAVWSSGEARAQYNNAQLNRKAQLLQLPVVDLKGTVEQVGADGMTIKCEGQSFLLAVDPSHTKMVCSGTAERSYLKPGVMVRFEGEFDRRMQLKGGPLEEVCVVTPSETSQPGIHTDSEGGSGGEGDEYERRPKQRGASENCVVIGVIKLIKDGQLQVVADGKPVKVPLADDAEIKVEVDDYSLAAAGDEIVVRGRTVQPPQGQQAGQVFGEDVAITLSQPLESTTKAPARKKKSGKGARPVKRAVDPDNFE